MPGPSRPPVVGERFRIKEEFQGRYHSGFLRRYPTYVVQFTPVFPRWRPFNWTVEHYGMYQVQTGGMLQERVWIHHIELVAEDA